MSLTKSENLITKVHCLELEFIATGGEYYENVS